MPLGIPLPGSMGDAFGTGLDSGGNLFARLLQQRQNEQAQHAFEFNKGLKLKQMAAQEKLEPYQMQLLQARIAAQQAAARKNEFESDPAKKAEYIRHLMSALTGGQMGMQDAPTEGPQMGGFTTAMDANGPQQTPIQFPGMAPEPQVQSPLPGFGMGQQAAPRPRAPDFSQLNDFQKAILKQQTGIDLTHKETPQEKDQRALALFMEKERFKNEAKSSSDLTELTPQTRSKYQSIIREVDSVMPVMNDLVEKGGQSMSGIGTANDLKYVGKIKRIADVYMKAKGWPNTDTARNDAIQLFKMGFWESKEDYKDRMTELQQELIHEKSLANQALKSKRVSSSTSNSDTKKEAVFNPITGQIE